MKIGIYIPTAVDQFAADTGLRMVGLLERLGMECYYPPELTDCGMELFFQGDKDSAKVQGEKMMEMYEDCECIVSCGSAAVTYMKSHFHSLFHNTTFHNSYRQFVDKLYDVSDFLVNVAHYVTEGVTFAHRVAFVDHCATRRDYISSSHPERKGLTEEPRQLLRAVAELELVDVQESEVCCGYGGLFANYFTPISDSLAKRKTGCLLAAGAEYVVSTELSCLLHLKSYTDKAGIGLKYAHLIDIIS